MEDFNGFCRGGYGVLSQNYGMIQYGNNTVLYDLFCQIALAGLGKRRPTALNTTTGNSKTVYALPMLWTESEQLASVM